MSMTSDWDSVGRAVGQDPSDPWESVGRRVPVLNRTPLQRAGENIRDAWERSGAGSLQRSLDPQNDGVDPVADFFLTPQILEGGNTDRVLDATLGQDRGYLRSVDGKTRRDAPMIARERARRAEYDSRANADPIRNPWDAVGFVAGQIVGSAVSPESWVGPGKQALTRIAGNIGVAAGTDALLQGNDIGAGVQDNYSPTQTFVSGAVGGLIQGGFEVGGAAGRRTAPAAAKVTNIASEWANTGRVVVNAAVDRVGIALRDNPVPAFDGPAMDIEPTTRALGGAAPSQVNASSPRRSTQSPAAQGVLFAPPVNGAVSSGFGPRNRPNARASANHQGIDYAVPEGTSVAAAADGEVIYAGPRGNYGNRVVVRHADGSETSYSHLSGFDVRVGDRVNLGQQIARSGSTGNVTGPHLHFEVRQSGSYVDPTGVLSGERRNGGGRTNAAENAPPADGSPFRRMADGPLAQSQSGPTQRLDRPPLTPEQQATVTAAATDPSLVPQVRAIFEPLYSTPREARTAARSAIFQARRAQIETPAIRPEVQRVTEQPTVLAARASAQASEWDAVGAAIETPRVQADQWDAVGTRVDAPEQLNIDMSGYAGRIGGTRQSSGQAVSGLRDAPRPDAVERGQGQAFAGKSVSDLAADLRQALGLTHRQGRVGAKGALGTYNTGSGVVRTKAVDELDVLAHEATHALEYERKGPALSAALKVHGKTLEGLAYPGAAQGVKREEGFAEFGRWYLTNPDHARRIAPQFYDAFEQAMQADAPDVLAGMKAVQGGYQNLLGSASIDVAKGSLAYTGSRGPVGNLIDEVRRSGPGSTLRRVVDDIYTASIDNLHPLSVAVRKLGLLYAENTGQKLELKRAQDPYALARLSREGYAAGHGDLMNGVTPYRGLDPEGPSLADALETAGIARTATGKLKNDALREFDVYMIARRMVHEWDRYARGELPNPPDRNTRQFHEQVIKDADAANPTWAQAANQTYTFLNNLWRKEFEAGLITQESYQNGLTGHPDYVPLMRDMSDKGVGGKGGKPRGALQFAGGVKAFEGSSRDIISPLSSIMRRTYELNAIIKRNDVMKALDDLAQAAGRGSGAIVERLPANEVEAFTVNAADALQKTAEELGLTGRDLTTMQKFADDALSNDATITLFKQTEFSPRKGEAVVFVWRGGKKTPLLLPDGEFGQQMFQALAGMNKDLSNIVVDGMAAGTQLLRYGVTMSPEFMAANIIRDSMATWINTDVGFVPGLDTLRGGRMELAQGQTAQRYATAGGMRGGANTAATQKPFPKTDAEAEDQLQHLRRKGWKVKRFASWRGLAEATDLSETSTRLGVFAKGFDQAKARGLSDYEAMIESGFTSRDYLDFARRGSKMMTASRIVTFLNAALQGLDKTTRVLTAGGNLKAVLTPLSKEARTAAEKRALGHAYKAWAKVSLLGAFGLGLRMLYSDDPEYQEINDRLRATHWVAKIGGQWVFIPKPFELATLSNIFERAYEGTILKDPTAGQRLLSDFRHTIAPPSEVPALAVPFNIGANRDYLGRPIVPDHLRGTVEPELQFNSYTSDLGKLIGKVFNVSPAVVDYTVTGFGGSLGRYVLQASNMIGEAVTGRPRTAAGPEDMFLARRFVRSIARGSDSQAEFWDNVSKDGGDLTRAEGSFRAFMRDAKDTEGAAYLNRLPPAERAYVIAKVFSAEGDSVIHPLVRTQRAISAIGDFRSDLRNGELRDGRGQVIPLTPQDRREIDNALGDFALSEMRNALIDTGIKGWAQKGRMDANAALRRIYERNPEAYNQLGIRLANEKAATAVHAAEQQRRQAQWTQMRPRYEGRFDTAMVVAEMQARRAKNGTRSDRYREAQRREGGVYTAPTNDVGISTNALQARGAPAIQPGRNALAQ